MSDGQLFEPVALGELELPNRIIMAPLTRGRAAEGGLPTPAMAEYYRLRASAGLIITEATAISAEGYGWHHAPGAWTDGHQQGWKMVTAAVREAGGRIALQLWHMGRVSHPDHLHGELPLAPSPIAARGMAHVPTGKKPYVTPRAMSKDDISRTVEDYAICARFAMEAGFDAVEIHGANGYLIDQFLRDGSNRRDDDYGGSVENRLRFLLEVVEAVCSTIPAGRVGLRFSPTGPAQDMHDSDPHALFGEAARQLNRFSLSYLHVVEPEGKHPMAGDQPLAAPVIRDAWKGKLIMNGGFTRKSGEEELRSHKADAIAYGVPFIANADLVERFRTNAPLNVPDRATFYTPGEKGYLDYPLLSEKAA